MKAFFKKELQTLQIKTGIRQLENLMQKENWKEEANLLIDLMVQECNKPPFDLVKADVKERVISRAIVEDKDFIGLNPKFVSKSLNAWWSVYGGKIIEAMNAKPEEVGQPVTLSPEENEKVNVMLESFKQRLTSGNIKPVESLTAREIKEEGEVRPKAHVYHSTDLSYQKQIDEKVRRGRELHFRENYPTATEEQILNYLKSFEH